MTGVPSRATAPAAVGFAGRTRHHIALRLLPFVFLLYVTNYLDRTSVAYAAIGMARDLGFDDRVFGLGIGIFFLSYVALQIPGAMLVQRWSARGMLCATMIVSGLLTALTAIARTPAQLYVARLLLGVGRSWFLPGRDRLSEPLVHRGGSGESDKQLHGCNSCVARHRIPCGGLDTQPQLVRYRRLALAFLAGRCSRDLVRRRGIFLSDRPTGSGALANCRAAAMDFAKVGTRKAVESTIDNDRSGIPFSYCAPARHRSLCSILHWIKCDFLVADYSQKPIRIFRSAGRAVRRYALRCGAVRDVV